ncbi:MAG TPA: hypothetical protein VLB73_03655 [Patescibacteria group bacterium]|nr:hypothetical protein [Patescibacteria group bacterium]
MKIITALFNTLHKPTKVLSSLDDYKQAALIKQGRTQFEKLLKKGLAVPVVLL